MEVWLTKDEKSDPDIQRQLQRVYAQYKKPHYTVVVYQSGTRDLYQSTLDLLAYNRKRVEELALHRKSPPPPSPTL